MDILSSLLKLDIANLNLIVFKGLIIGLLFFYLIISFVAFRQVTIVNREITTEVGKWFEYASLFNLFLIIGTILLLFIVPI